MAGYKAVSFLLVIVMIMLKAYAQPAGLQSDIDAIEQQARRYEEALAIGDIATIQNLYAEDCRVFPTGAPPYRGRESNYLHSHMCSY